MELKLLREDIHRITLELKERALKVEKLQSKFEVVSSKQRGAGDDEDGEPKSQAYYVIKAAQEREELQREVRPPLAACSRSPHWRRATGCV